MLRIWDCFLLEGTKVLFRYTCALLFMHKQILLEQTDTISIFKHLKYAVKYTFDVDGLTKIAFETLKPFPRRKDISTKQTYFLRMINDKWQARLLAKNSYFQQEKLHDEEKCDNKQNNLIIECATYTSDHEIWICYGGQQEGNIMYANTKTGFMFPIKINVNFLKTKINFNKMIFSISVFRLTRK